MRALSSLSSLLLTLQNLWYRARLTLTITTKCMVSSTLSSPLTVLFLGYTAYLHYFSGVVPCQKLSCPIQLLFLIFCLVQNAAEYLNNAIAQVLIALITVFRFEVFLSICILHRPSMILSLCLLAALFLQILPSSLSSTPVLHICLYQIPSLCHYTGNTDGLNQRIKCLLTFAVEFRVIHKK